MAAVWCFLLWGITLVQSHSTFDRIVSNDEWEDFENLLHNSSYRLPTTTKPSLYELFLTPYFDNVPEQNISPFTFHGEVFIHISPTQANVKNIVLHCNDLTIHTLSIELNEVPVALTTNSYECEEPYDFLKIETAEDLLLDSEYVIKITFNGNIQTDMRGFYRSWYRDDTGERRWIGTTQFQPGHARKAFPCYDEPGYKAFFDVTIVRQQDFSPSISNMPIRNTNQTLDGRMADTFYRTPLMSTYLLAFIVSDFIPVAQNNDPNRPFEIYARNNSGTTGDWSLEIGELLLAAMEQYTQYPYYTMAENMNMKQAAVSDFSAGAMENWGLLIYRESLLLYDPENSNNFYKQRIANIVSHEIAHMWFGNLVTCTWWDNLWLNEGFARFFQYFLTNTVAPELGYDTRFIVEQVHLAMFEDSINSAHPLTNNVSDPDSVWANFSPITYAKGASVIRMTQFLLGESTFVRGLRMYLAERAFNVAEPDHLFDALDRSAEMDRSLREYDGLTIASFLKPWSEEAGYPLLQISVNQATGRMSLFQRRWERDIGISISLNTWPIPITWTRANAADFQDLKPSSIFNATIGFLNRGTTDLEWVIFNKQQSGFYRVDYDDTNWALLTRALRSDNRTIIHEYNRAQIVDDLLAFGRTGRKTYTQVFNILSFLEFEDAYAPWIAAINGFNFVVRRLAHDPTSLQKLQAEIIRLSTAVTDRLGYSEIDGEPFMDGLLRMYVLTFLCNIEHPQCKEAAREHFQRWKQGENLPPNMRPWVYCSGLRQGSADDFNYFWNRYENEDLANEVVVMLEAAGCTTDFDSLYKFLNAIVNVDDTVRPQDKTVAFNSAISGNEINTLRFFDWLKRNLQTVSNVYGSVEPLIGYITSRLNDVRDIDEFSEWLEENRETIGTSAYNRGVSGITTARVYMAWHLLRLSEFETYFENGYVEDVIDVIVDEETEEEDDITDVPDSSNFLHLNFSILFVIILLYSL